MPKGFKVGGRVSGTPNRITAGVRERFKTLIDNYSEEAMQSDLDSLNPKDRLIFITDIAEYVIPKLQRTEITGGANNKMIIEIVRKYPSLIELPAPPATEGSQ